jgi:hypothetical protein
VGLLAVIVAFCVMVLVLPATALPNSSKRLPMVEIKHLTHFGNDDVAKRGLVRLVLSAGFANEKRTTCRAKVAKECSQDLATDVAMYIG